MLYSPGVIPDGVLVGRKPDTSATHRLLIGPQNRHGQATAWSEAVRRRVPEADAASCRLVAGPDLYPADLTRDPTWTDDATAADALQRYIEATYTHVLIEAGKALIGKSVFGDANRLRAAGLHVGVVATGSDVRVPSEQAERRPWNPYERFGAKRLARREKRSTAVRNQLLRYPGPVFVTAAGLLEDLPGATWLPLVVDSTHRVSDRPALTGDRPVVAFAPDSGPGRPNWIDPVLTGLAADGVIEYLSLADVPAGRLPEVIGSADVVIDEIGSDDYGLTAVVALSAGRSVLGMVSAEVRDHVRLSTGLELPVTQVDPGTVRDVLLDLRERPEAYRRQASRGPEFAAAVHSGDRSVDALAELLDRSARTMPTSVPRRPPVPTPARPEATTGRRPHVLYVAWGFPPCRGGGVYRALATANALHRIGFDVTVLTAKREVFERFTGADTSLEALVDREITVERLDFDWPILESEISLWSRDRAKDPQGWVARRREEDQRDFPEVNYGPWKSRLLAAADEIAERRPIDLVIGTANPNVDLVVGPHLHATRGVPYVMDYRDAWRLDVFSGDELELDPRVKELEAAYVAEARELWFVNDQIRTWHEREYPAAAGRMFTVMNGYDEDLAPVARGRGPEPGAALRFGYIGTISPKVPIAEFVAGWRLARETDAVLRRSSADLWGYLGFFAADNPRLKSLVASAAKDDVFFRGRVDKTDVVAAYESFDVLLLILGAGIYVTSGKVFEYMSSGLPIVSVHDPGNAASSVLDGYPLWFPAEDMSAPAIGAALSAAAAAATAVDEETRRACVEFATAFERDRQLRPRIEHLVASCQETA